MKALLLANGGSVHTVRWAEGLAQAGVEVVLVTQHRDVLPLPSLIKVHQLPFAGQPGYFLNRQALRRIWNQERPALVNAHYASGYGTTARLSGCKPLLLSVWGSDVYQFPQRSRLHHWWLRGNLAAATRLASTSRAMAEQVHRVAPESEEIAITPFGIDLNTFSAPQADWVSADVADAIVIGTVKTLRPVYGIDILIESFARLKETLRREAPLVGERLRLRIVGDGPQKEFLKALAERRGIAAVTEFVSKVPHSQVPGELAKLQIYVALSRQESFGVAVLEAGACGLPVVVSDVGGLPEVVMQGETGLVVPGECPDAAAEALKTLVLDSQLCRALGRAARNHVERHYSWAESVRRMVALYEETRSLSPPQRFNG